MAVPDLTNIILRGIQTFEREERNLNMLLFPEIIDHIVRIDRVLSLEGGAMLLVGKSGVGRRSACQLVAHMHGMKVFAPNITRNYNVRNFYNDVKTVLASAGVAGEEVVLYVEEHHVTDESILESINSLLSSGEVPGLYAHEELESLLSPLKEQMSEVGYRFRTPYEYFVSRVVANLHIVISMDPSHPRFAVRCESNPALYTKCTVLWFGEWRKHSMRGLPRLMLPKMLELIKDPEHAVDQLVAIHDSCKNRGATPLDFVVFLRAYEALYQSQVGGIETRIKSLQSGLSKLLDAEKTVDTLTRDATQQRGELKVKQTEADEAMEQITEALANASDRRRQVETLQVQLVDIEKGTLTRKAEVEEELSSITPLLEQAKKAVGGIDNAKLAEIKALPTPPVAIHDVLSGVLQMLGYADTSWASMRKFLGTRGVKEQILAFDARAISPGIRKAVQKILKDKANSFEKEVIANASAAAAPLAMWVKANVRYSLVIEKIQPLEDELQAATAKLMECQAKLDDNNRELSTLDSRVAALKAEFGKRTAEAEKLRAALQRTEETLGKAQSLLLQLSGEKVRWERQVGEMRKAIATLPTQMMLAAGFSTYLTKSPEDVRVRKVNEWMEMCRLDSFDFMKLLSSESEMLVWKSQGLPSDSLSMQNAIVLMKSVDKCPFIIDPATAATKWLEDTLAKVRSVIVLWLSMWDRACGLWLGLV